MLLSLCVLSEIKCNGISVRFHLKCFFIARMRFTPSSTHRNADNGGRNTAAGEIVECGGGVRRRAKSPTSMPSSCENSSPQHNRDEDTSTREQPAEDEKKKQNTDSAPKNQQSSEESCKWSHGYFEMSTKTAQKKKKAA